MNLPMPKYYSLAKKTLSYSTRNEQTGMNETAGTPWVQHPASQVQVCLEEDACQSITTILIKAEEYEQMKHLSAKEKS